MSAPRLFVLRDRAIRLRAAAFCMEAPADWAATFKEANRTSDQNAAQWPILDAFSKQLKWPVNGQLVYMTDEEWKDVLTAAFRKERVRLAMGLDGGMVMLGQRTSKFGKSEFSEWLDFLNATAAQRGVQLKEPATT